MGSKLTAGEANKAIWDACSYGELESLAGDHGCTMLACERVPGEDPLYLGDLVRLRPVADRRHLLSANLTLVRAPDAVRVDWMRIAIEQPPVRGAQFDAFQGITVDKATGKPRVRPADLTLAEKHPEVAAFIASLAARKGGAGLRGVAA